jgi:hypothetical protein
MNGILYFLDQKEKENEKIEKLRNLWIEDISHKVAIESASVKEQLPRIKDVLMLIKKIAIEMGFSPEEISNEKLENYEKMMTMELEEARERGLEGLLKEPTEN